MASAKNPISEVGKDFQGFLQCVLNFFPAGRAYCSAAWQIIPPTLPTKPLPLVSQVAIRVKLQVKLDAWLIGKSTELAEPSVAQTNRRTPQHLKVVLLATSKFLKFGPVK